MWIGSKFTSLSDSLFRLLFKFLFRYDVFISYARGDGKEYALKLRDQLKQLDFSCFLDADELPPGNSLNSTLKRALRKSATLVVVGTERATRSRYVELEVGEFSGSGRAIIPIDIEGTLAEAPWGVLRERDLVWIDEARASLACGVPSPNVADSIDKLFKYTRRNSRVRAQVLATLIFFVLVVVGSLFAIRQQVRAANVASAEAERQKVEAGNQKTAAEEASRRAEAAKAEALQAQANAREAQAKATKAERAAGEAAKEAKRQEALALSSAESAKKQQRIAEERTNYVRAQQIAVQADIDVDKGGDPERSVLLSVESLKRAWTPEGYAAWAKGMALLPHAGAAKFSGPVEKVSAVAYSPDGRFFAQGTEEGGVTFFRTDGTAEPVRRQLGGEVKTIVFGEGWAGAASETKFAMWDTKGFDETRSSKTLKGFRGQSVAFSPDGRYVATGGPVSNQPLRVFDTASSHAVIDARLEHVGYVMNVAFSPDGRWLAAACVYKKYEEKQDEESSRARDNAVEIVSPQDKASVGRVLFWDVSSFEKGAEAVPAPAGWFDEEEIINRVVFGPKGERLATEDQRGVVRVWQILDDDEGRLRLKRPGSNVARLGGVGVNFKNYGKATLVFSPDESYIAAVPDKSSVRLWNVGSMREVSRVMHDEEVESVAFSPDGHFATADNGGVKFWKTEFGSEGARLVSADKTSRDGAKDIAVSPGGEWLAAAVGDGARVYSTADWTSLKTLKTGGTVSKLTFSADGRWLVAAGEGKATVFATNPWDEGLELTTAGPESKATPAVGFSTDTRIMIASSYGLVKLFEVGSWREIRALPQESTVKKSAFSTDGQWLAVFVAGDTHGRHLLPPNEVHVWSTSNWTQAACRDDSPRPGDGTQEGRGSVCADVKGTAREVALSEVLRWKVTLGPDPLKETPGPRDGEYISPDGRWSVEKANGTLLRFYEGKNERPVATLASGDWTFTADSRWLLINSDGTVGLWPLGQAGMIEAACARVRRRDLTEDERKQYLTDGLSQPTCAPAR